MTLPLKSSRKKQRAVIVFLHSIYSDKCITKRTVHVWRKKMLKCALKSKIAEKSLKPPIFVGFKVVQGH